MLTQIFKKDIPIEFLFELLEKISVKNDKYYIVDINSYKKMLFYGYNIDFLNILADYYHSSKRYYAERDLTFNAFTTIIRQICKSNTVQFTSQIKYNSSKYSIEYLIYF